MKYFTKQLWNDMNHSDPVIREAAAAQWAENDRSYSKVFEAVKPFLPDAFLDCFFSNEGFHDFSIREIRVFQDGKMQNCLELLIGKRNTTLAVCMHNIRNLQISIPSFDNCLNRSLTWGYCEFERNEAGTLCVALLCDIQNSIELECDTLDVSEVN